ncbi:MAG: EpsG family protein [Mesorhizobium sp.]|uniref:EpsG family protein n=1 Tax=Mesorhizobium sp. TaxID=1871066 RepID=UPI001AD57CDE|nr:EpsG family protein [Mesorhizobium sp.]MBN9220966.1 EpsG family protein [Mesorhizobium sp.]
MVPYWLLFGISAFASFFETPHYRLRFVNVRFVLVLMLIAITLVVGLRYEVGGDWKSYIRYFFRASYSDFSEIPSLGDPGYMLVNWIAARLGGGIWLVNLVCATLFSWGLLSFAAAQPRPWLALVIATPYLIVVVAMGYTRQGVAIGMAMQGLVALGTYRSNMRFVIWILLAATFHKSAVLLIPIAALTENRGRFWTICWVGAATVLAYFALLESSVDKLMRGYINREYDSGGANVRVAMNVLPAFIALYYKKFPFRLRERPLWKGMSVIALALIPILMYSPSSTAIDRIGLYLIPLQLVVLSRLPDFVSRRDDVSRLVAVFVIVYSAAIMFTWLNYSSYAVLWVPYRMYFIQG